MIGLGKRGFKSKSLRSGTKKEENSEQKKGSEEGRILISFPFFPLFFPFHHELLKYILVVSTFIFYF